MILILDFDDTLFSSNKYITALVRDVLSAFGISQECFDKTREEMRQEFASSSSPQYYDLKRHIELMLKDNSGAVEEVHKAALDFTRTRGKEFLFDDVIPFLEKHKKDITFVLVTYSDPVFQKTKIEGTTIGNYFDELFFVGKQPKAKIINEFIKRHTSEKTFVFVDDRDTQLTETKETCPDVIGVMIKRKGGRYISGEVPRDCHEVTNMQELETLLQTFYDKE